MCSANCFSVNRVGILLMIGRFLCPFARTVTSTPIMPTDDFPVNSLSSWRLLSFKSLNEFKNILTFNPGWDSNAQPLPTFTDVRELQRQLKAQGVTFASEADETTTGPASFVVVDPDGNPILVDQHR